MKRFSFLLPGSKKPKSKSPATSPAPPPPYSLTAVAPAAAAAAAAHNSELDLLLAQAEATLGELLVRAGASFEAKSSSLSLSDRPPVAPSRSHIESGGLPSHLDDTMKSSVISSGSRSAKFSCEAGHGRKRSLSRVWQQLGGNLFCGSGQMSGYVMDQEMMAAAVASTDIYDHDGLLNESYWQSLAESIITQKKQQQQQHQQQQMDAKLAEDDSVGDGLVGCEDMELCCCSNGKEQVQNDEARGEVRYAENLQQELDRESEIVQLLNDGDDDHLSGRSSLQDKDSMAYKTLVGAGRGGVVGCTRLNTTLEESPNLAYNYLSLKVGLSAQSSTSNLMNPVRFPDANPGYEVDTGCNSSSYNKQPLERLLRETAEAQRAGGASRSAPAFNCQEPTGSEMSATSSSCRVSLMALLHEEAAAAAVDAAGSTAEESYKEVVVEEEGAAGATGGAAEVVAVVGKEELSRATAAAAGRTAGGEDVLLCCVCMIRRKGAALIPCGHTFCRTCSKQLFTDRGACPLCNTLIVQVLDIF